MQKIIKPDTTNEKRPITAKYPQVGFRCFVDRKLVNLNANLRRKFIG